MKSIIVTTALMITCVGMVFGGVEFVDSASPGAWQYDGVNTFSFIQPITVSDVDGSGADALNGMYVHLPVLTVSGYMVLNPGTAAATVTPQGSLQIWDTPDQTGTMLMQADFVNASGSFFAYFAAGNLYAPDMTDLAVSAINNSIGSDFLSSLDMDTLLGLVLTLNHEDNFTDFMFQTPAVSAAGGFSGQIDIAEDDNIPEPATLALLAMGGLVLLRKRK
jgi:hypothetical protein